jgi:hypothetical protein
MKSASLIVFLVLASTVGKCFSQQTAQSNRQEVEAVVTKLYKQIIFRKPDGLMRKKDFDAIQPFLSEDLIKRIRVAGECEKDYFRQYPYNPAEPMKPPFAWMETGLFSGSNEQALPSWFRVHHAVKQKDGSYQVRVTLKEWDDFNKYPQPRGPEYDWTWEMMVFVIRDGDHYVVNDVFYPEIHSDHDEPRYPTVEETRLSQLLAIGCKDGKWVGYPDQE